MLDETYALIAPTDAVLDKVQNELLPLSITVDSLELNDKCLLYNYCDYLAEQLEAAKKMIEKIQDLVAVNINHDMTKKEFDKVTIHGFNWYPKTDTKFNCTVEKQPQLLAWAKSNAPELVKEAIHPQTLKAFCNGLLEAGKQPPAMLSKFEVETVLRRKDKA